WKPLDPDNPTPAEVNKLGYRDRLWGRRLYLQGRFAEAEKILTPVLNYQKRGDNNRTWAIIHLAFVLCVLKRFDEIISLIHAELTSLDAEPILSRLEHHNAQLKSNRSETLIKLGRYDEARA